MKPHAAFRGSRRRFNRYSHACPAGVFRILRKQTAGSHSVMFLLTSTMQIYGIKEIKTNITALKRLISTAI